MKRFAILLLLGAAGCGPRRPAAAQGLEVRRIEFEDVEMVVADADMRRVRMRMLSRGPEIRELSDAEEVLRKRGERVLLATNGGLFHSGVLYAGAPMGLQVEDGHLVRPLRLGSTPGAGESPGNFFYLPNAVLYQDRQGRVAIRESAAMRGREGEVRDGLQSGPALLLGGRVHPVAQPPNRGRAHERRTAACIPAPGRLAIVYAEEATTFPQLARFLQARLGCRDAVFLDANVVGLYIPHAGIDVEAQQFAGVLTLTVPLDTVQ